MLWRRIGWRFRYAGPHRVEEGATWNLSLTSTLTAGRREKDSVCSRDIGLAKALDRHKRIVGKGKNVGRAGWFFGRPDAITLMLCIGLVLGVACAVGPNGRRKARQVTCQSHLQQWSGIFADYIARNEGEFVEPASPAGWYWVMNLDDRHKDWRQTRIWLCPEADRPLMDERGEQTPGNPVFRAWGIYTGASYGPNGLAGSYGLNGYVLPIPAGFEYADPDMPAEVGWGDLREVPHAQDVPLFIDALRFDLWPRSHEPPASSESSPWYMNQMARCCINRHSGTVSCLFVDGSVRAVGLKELWTLKWHRQFDTSGPWTLAGGAQPSDWPEWIRPFKEY